MESLLKYYDFAKEEFLKDPFTGSLTILITVIALCAVYASKGSSLKLPPGPRGLPLIGYLPLLQKSPHVHFSKLKEKYGSVIRIKAFHREVVILNDFDVIKDAFSKEESLNRPDYLIFNLLKIKGVAAINGEEWRDNRRYSMHVLRDLGFGKRSMEERVKDEIVALIQRLEETRGKPADFEDVLTPSMSNNIYSLVFGERLDYKHPDRKFLDTMLRTFVNNVNFLSVINFVPLWIQKIAFKLVSRQFGFFGELLSYTRNKIEEHEKTMDPACARDFIDGYLLQMPKEKASHFNKDYLIGSTINFFGAGSNTVRITIQWHLLTMAVYPKIQNRIHQEIVSVIGNERAPAWEDHKSMPYTQAVIWEIYRWRTIAPLGLPRYTPVNMKIGGYDIKAGTMLLANLWNVHNDPALWKDPETFNPDRFFNEDGTLQKKPEHLMPFSIGKRMCPGETLANVEVFLYLTTILQKFTVVPEEGETISLESQEKFVTIPFLKKLKFLLREVN